jgi:hypothetical protein
MNALEVVFNAPGAVKIVVSAQGVDDGSQIRLRVTMSGEAIESLPAIISSGKAEFNIDVPAGEGTIQAYLFKSVIYSDESSGGGSNSGGGSRS